LCIVCRFLYDKGKRKERKSRCLNVAIVSIYFIFDRRLTWVNALKSIKVILERMTRPADVSLSWLPVSTAPFDCELELAVIDSDGVHAIAFPCRRVLRGWIHAETSKRINIHPTHWRRWKK
jgi:hypothetical protein